MKNSFGFSHILILLALLLVSGAAVLLYLYSVKNLSLPGQVGTDGQKPTVKLQAQYNNPFDKNSQYSNPFSQYKNPFVVAK